MSRYIESIRIVNGRMMNVKYHQDRINRTFIHEKVSSPFKLSAIKKITIPKKGVFKYRIEYNPRKNLLTHEISPYIEKNIKNLKLVTADTFDYSLKYAKRNFINQAYAQKGNAADVLFIKNNLITDTSYCNVALWNGHQWLTPKNPLLKGTMRQKLIDKNIIKEENIIIKQLSSFLKIRLFNALIPWSNQKDILIKNIIK